LSPQPAASCVPACTTPQPPLLLSSCITSTSLTYPHQSMRHDSVSWRKMSVPCWITQEDRLIRCCYRIMATMQCHCASLCVHPQLCTSFFNVCRADVNSHLQCWMLESVVTDIEMPSAHPVCTGMVRLFPVSQSSTSSAVMPGCHL